MQSVHHHASLGQERTLSVGRPSRVPDRRAGVWSGPAHEQWDVPDAPREETVKAEQCRPLPSLIAKQPVHPARCLVGSCETLGSGGGERHDVGGQETPVPRYQWHSVYETRSGDDLVSRIARDVELRRLAAYCEVERPDAQRGECAGELWRLQVQLEPPELNQLREFPQHDGRYTPLLGGQEASLGIRKVAAKGKDENVGIKVQQGCHSARR